MAQATTASPPITVEQYEQFAGYAGLRDELINGRIIMSPQPKPLHQQIADNLLHLLRSQLPYEYVAKHNTNIRFSRVHSMPAPDVLIVKRKEWVEACSTEQYLSTPPLLVVEIISPANRKRRVQEKVLLYLEQGVRNVWVVMPRTKEVMVHHASVPNGHLADERIALANPLTGSILRNDIFRLDT